MRRVQYSNVKPVLKSEYLWCNSKRNKPQLHHTICEARCKEYMACHEYGKWYFKYYGEELEKPKKKRKVVRRRTKKAAKK